MSATRNFRQLNLDDSGPTTNFIVFKVRLYSPLTLKFRMHSESLTILNALKVKIALLLPRKNETGS